MPGGRFPVHGGDPVPLKPPFAARLVVGLAGASLLAHLLVSVLGPYGIRRDAFLYMAMGEHLRLWNMDFPPLIAILSRGIRGLVGDSIVALRLVPAAASAGLIVIAGLSARELEGGRFAQGLAALAVLASPLYLRTGTLFQPVALDQLWWTLGLFFLLKLTSTGDPRWWIPFGAAAGLGRVDHPYAVAEQRNQTIFVCRDPLTTLQELWPTVRGTN